MATNNATNTSKPVTVPQGGTGNTSMTAYAVICGGTTSTGNLQSIAAVGTSTHVLTSNGASALPTFQALPAASNGYVMTAANTSDSGVNPVDATTYFMGRQDYTSFTASGGSSTRTYIPKTGTIKACYGAVTVRGTLGSGETSAINIRLNNTTDTLVQNKAFSSAINAFSNSGLSISVTQGDYIEFKIVSPTWATNPTSVSFSGSIYIE